MYLRSRPRKLSLDEVLLTYSKTDEGGCRLWLGDTRNGYGRIGHSRTVESTHRAAYRIWNGEIPEGHHVHHLCGKKLCINPAHLCAVSPAEHLGSIHLDVARGNIKAAQAASRERSRAITHCVHGHELTPENTWVRKEGWRQCKTCNRERMATRKARLRLAAAVPVEEKQG